MGIGFNEFKELLAPYGVVRDTWMQQEDGTYVYANTLDAAKEGDELALEVTEWRTYETAAAALDPGAAQDLLEAQLSQRLTQQLGEGGEVVSSAFTARAADGMLYVTLQAECLEQIGREVTFPGTAGEILSGTDAGTDQSGMRREG